MRSPARTKTEGQMLQPIRKPRYVSKRRKKPNSPNPVPTLNLRKDRELLANSDNVPNEFPTPETNEQYTERKTEELTQLTQEIPSQIDKALVAIAEGNSLQLVSDFLQISKGQLMRELIYSSKQNFENYKRARSIAIEARMSEFDDIIDSELDLERARLKIDVAKWRAARLIPEYQQTRDEKDTGKTVVILDFSRNPDVTPSNVDVRNSG